MSGPRSLAPGAELAAWLQAHPAVVLSGAGISTESGIPDYRGPDGSRGRRQPMRFAEFTRDPEARRRYWARSLLGWRRVAEARPNAGHRAVARLEARGLVRGVITQNVDGLHQAAGSRRVLELHGNLATVRCLDCGARSGRAELQRRLAAAHPELLDVATNAAPDGDADLDPQWIAAVDVPACERCGGRLAPDVVFFGENVARARVERAYALLGRGAGLLVLGSSLTVFSGYRFVRRAEAWGLPVAIVNDGPTRGDPHAELRVPGRLGEVLTGLEARLAPPAPLRSASATRA